MSGGRAFVVRLTARKTQPSAIILIHFHLMLFYDYEGFAQVFRVKVFTLLWVVKLHVKLYLQMVHFDFED